MVGTDGVGYCGVCGWSPVFATERGGSPQASLCCSLLRHVCGLRRRACPRAASGARRVLLLPPILIRIACRLPLCLILAVHHRPLTTTYLLPRARTQGEHTTHPERRCGRWRHRQPAFNITSTTNRNRFHVVQQVSDRMMVNLPCVWLHADLQATSSTRLCPISPPPRRPRHCAAPTATRWCIGLSGSLLPSVQHFCRLHEHKSPTLTSH